MRISDWSSDVCSSDLICLFIQLRAHLVEVGNLQIGALLDGAGIGSFIAQYHFQQRRFAGTVPTDQPDVVATQNTCAEIVHDDLVALRIVDLYMLDHDTDDTLAGCPILTARKRLRTN